MSSDTEATSDLEAEVRRRGVHHFYGPVPFSQRHSDELVGQAFTLEGNGGLFEVVDDLRRQPDMVRHVVLQLRAEYIHRFESDVEQAIGVFRRSPVKVRASFAQVHGTATLCPHAQSVLNHRFRLQLDRVEVIEDLLFFLAKLLGTRLSTTAQHFSVEIVLNRSRLLRQFLEARGVLEEILQERGKTVNVGLQIQGLVVRQLRRWRKDLLREVATLEIVRGYLAGVAVENSGVQQVEAVGTDAVKRSPIRVHGHTDHAPRVPLAMNDAALMKKGECGRERSGEAQELLQTEAIVVSEEVVKKMKRPFRVSVSSHDQRIGRIVVVPGEQDSDNRRERSRQGEPALIVRQNLILVIPRPIVQVVRLRVQKLKEERNRFLETFGARPQPLAKLAQTSL